MSNCWSAACTGCCILGSNVFKIVAYECLSKADGAQKQQFMAEFVVLSDYSLYWLYWETLIIDKEQTLNLWLTALQPLKYNSISLPSSVQTLFRLILSLLRLKSVSSQASPASPTCCTPVSPGGRLGGAGGAFSWSLRCSSCRTSSVFSRWRSPGIGVTMALWWGNTRDTDIYNSSII